MPTPRPRKAAPEIDLAEMQNSHAFKGMLSFLDESAQERRLRLTGSIDHPPSDHTDLNQQTAPSQVNPDDQGTKESSTSSTPSPVNDIQTDHPPLDQSSTDQHATAPSPVGLLGIDHNSLDLHGVDPLSTAHLLLESEFIDQDDRHANLEDSPALLLHGKAKPKPARTVQDGHSSGEDKIYDVLWKYSKPHTPEARLLSVGYSALAELSRMAPTNCRANIFSLIEKKAIEEYKTHTKGHATTYLIYNYAAILRRRKEAGLTHVIRTRGVVFVNPETCKALTRQMGEFRLKGRTLLTQGSIVNPSLDRRTIDHSAMGSTLTGKGSVRERSERSIHQRSPSPNRLKSLSSNDDGARLRPLLQAQLPVFDDFAVDSLWRDCRQQVPDVNEEEIATLFAIKLPGSRIRGIDNQNGFLITAVARSCTPAAISALRQGREVPKQTPSIRIPADELAAMLEDPKTPEWMLELIRAKMVGE